MYNDLYAAWRREVEDSSLGGLSSDFYAKISEYLKLLREDNKVPDKKSLKANLLDHEAKNVRQMLDELLNFRYEKLLKTITQNQKIPTELLAVEEAKICESFVSFTSSYQKFTQELTQGQASQASAQIPRPEPVGVNKRLTLRFTKNIPKIMGADMKPYGPFLIEDVASLPAENARILVKQGLAVQVDVS